MRPLIVLIAAFVIVVIFMKVITKSTKWQLAGRISMSVMLLFTSIGHFLFPEGMAAMIPGVFCCKNEIILVTGLLEVVFAISLIFVGNKVIIGWVIIAFFVAILPANIYAALEHINYQTGSPDGPGPEYLWFRVPLQLFFILWVYFSTRRV